MRVLGVAFESMSNLILLGNGFPLGEFHVFLASLLRKATFIQGGVVDQPHGTCGAIPTIADLGSYGSKQSGVINGRYAEIRLRLGNGRIFVVTLIGHWLFGWFAYVNEQQAHKQPIEWNQYMVQMTRDTLENWQSEFLQLLWGVAGLALLLHVGSPQSKEGDDRMEAKIGAILLAVDTARKRSSTDDIYEGRHTDAGLKRLIAVREERTSRRV